MSRASQHGFGRAALTQFASLPAETFVPNSESSGSLLGTDPINGITPPLPTNLFRAFSGVVRNRDGTFETLSDNGYGTLARSADFLLRIHRIKLIFSSGAMIYLADNRDRNNDGVMDKTLVADLLDIANPKQVGGFPETFRFPFSTIEDLVILDDRTLGVLNDNNFPFSDGRTPDHPDNNEFITIRLTRSLSIDASDS